MTYHEDYGLRVFDRKILRPWIRRFCFFLAIIIWVFSVVFSSLSYIAKSNEALLKEHASKESRERTNIPGSQNRPDLEPDLLPLDAGGSTRASVDDWMPEWLKDLTLFSLRWGWVGVPIAAGLELLRKWLKSSVRDRQTEKAIKRVINHFYDETKPADGMPINYRVTLFKYRRFSFTMLFAMCIFRNKRNPWGGWLCPYERSSAFRNKTHVRWPASFEVISENKGVVGRVFCEGTAVRVEDLPAKSELKNSEKKRREYAAATNCSLAWITKKARGKADIPRSFWGTRVEPSSDGVPWGVILIDSNLPKLSDDAIFDRESKMVLKMLSILIPSNKEE